MPKVADDAVQDVLISNWLREFDEGTNYTSPSLFLELRLRQALSAVDHRPAPDAFRTATVCECLARLAEAGGPLKSLLELLRLELLRSVYVGFDQAEAASKRRHTPIDAEALLRMPTYFGKAHELQQANVELSERIAMWERTKLELKRDAEVRAELLRVALTRFSAVMCELAGGGLEAEEVLAKVGAQLEALRQHNEAIGELQRPAMVDPLARLHHSLQALSPGTRHRALVVMLQMHGADTFAAQSQVSLAFST